MYAALGGVRSELAHGGDTAIGVFVGISQSSLTLNSIPTLDFVTQLFKQFGITARSSRAGLVASRLIAQMGGLQGCRVFKIGGVRKLIEAYAPDQHFDRTTANKTIGNFDEANSRMRFEPFEQLFLGPRTREKLQPQDALDNLLNRGVFRVGLELLCPHCELPSRLHLDDLATKVECPLCGSAFDITHQLRDRNWAYRRSGLFGGTSDHQHGSVPVAVTLQQLDTHLSSLGTSGMVYTTSLNLEPAGAAIDRCETDFVVVRTGPTHVDPNVPEVVIGECKSRGGRITAQDTTNLGKVADALPRRRVRTYIVFSKTGTFDEEEVQAAALAQDKWTSRVVLLSQDELEPYDLFERHEKDVQRLRSEGLSGLAAFTAHKYTVLKPKGDGS